MFALLLLILMIGCGQVYVKNISRTVKREVESDLRTLKAEGAGSQLKLKGFFSAGETEYNSLTREVGEIEVSQTEFIVFFFYPNGACYMSRRSFSNNREVNEGMRFLQAEYRSQNHMPPVKNGFYFIDDNKISAWLPIQYFARRGGNVQYVLSHFEGEVVNDSTIVDWRIVEPFQEPSNFNEEWKLTNDGAFYNYLNFEGFKIHRTLRFKAFEPVSRHDQSLRWLLDEFELITN
ncbi:hypothetical protein F8C67_09410 [Phaeocystidibacter luteus]|uniref:Uncharacterized protein n=2 Tax=Phaeocystidibacter luteus TaxID=911197 RepID=A0A6N6RFC4_9FLAO|nr:hypothetical protein F8C67_09410 [Phaeocystidibacter luteus]